MKTYDPSSPIVSIHIPKTGGTSLLEVLRKWYGWKLIEHYPNGKQKKQILIRNRIAYMVKPRGLCVHGHFNRLRNTGVDRLPIVPKQFFAFFRDPLLVQFSTYRYKMNRMNDGVSFWDWNKFGIPKDIDDFLYRYNSNMLLHFPIQLTERNFRDYFDEFFVFLGLTSHLDSHINLLASTLSKQTIPIPRINVTDQSLHHTFARQDAIDAFYERNQLVFEIFNHVKQLYET